jgi:two pore calcium channel protein 1
VYAFEACLKLCGLGITNYFNSGWNSYDFVVTAAGVVGACVEAVADVPFVFIVILRPLRLLRLFKLKRRYRDVFSALAIVLPRMASAAIVLLIVYYFFAVAGMELFGDVDLRNCCK